MTKIGVRIMPREVLLDSQGRAVERSLELSGMPGVKVRVGKFVELEIEGTSEEVETKARDIAKKVLCNPLIENFELVKKP